MNRRLWYLLFAVIVLIIIILFLRSRHHQFPPVKWIETKDGKVSWNILFKPGTDKAARDQAVNNIKDYITTAYEEYNKLHGANYAPISDTAYFCPCDTLLYNFDFLAIDGAGKSVTTTPSTPPKVPGSGDFVGAVISNNALLIELKKALGVVHDSNGVALVRNIPTDPSRILAIIDSGLDSSFFSPAIRNVIWADPSSSTIYNFLPGQSTLNVFDSTKEKHGTAVAAIIIKAMENTSVYPKLMILRALDSSNTGSIYSVSCALSYAIQKNATLINLSLGYYGDADSILHHYIALTAAPGHSIGVFVAAGNTPGNHDSALCNNNNANLLTTPTRLFYPACFSKEFKNIISVTQISKQDSSCFYQNYSNEFINLGVYDSINCCETEVNFTGYNNQGYNNIKYNQRNKNYQTNKDYYEGSSFVTPIASGLKMGTILNATSPVDSIAKWNALIKTDTNFYKITEAGKYIKYSSGN